MGVRHNTLNDSIFRNSKYINTLENELNIADFRKENKEQYDFMLDTFSTLILLNNCFYSDSNLSFDDKIYNALEIIQNYLYLNYDEENEKNKYSVRFIKAVIDRHCAYLFKKINEWYIDLDSMDTSINRKRDIVKEIDEEITRLDTLSFDSVVKGGIEYQKNKDSNYKIYISKFNNLYTDFKASIKQYVDDFNNLYGIELTNDDLQEIAFIFDLVASANNGIVSKIYDRTQEQFNLSEVSTLIDIYTAYLKTLNIDIKDNELIRYNADNFLAKLTDTADKLNSNKDTAFLVNDYPLDYLINNYEYLFFIANIESVQIKLNNLVINKIINDLKSVYDLIKDDNLQEAFNKVQAIIERNKNYFERVS